MLFNSFEFIVFFVPIVFSGYFFLNKRKLTTLSRWWLLCASLFFYGWWNVYYLPLIISSVVFNFVITQAMVTARADGPGLLSPLKLLQVGLIFNIGFLAYFKYMDFFLVNVNLAWGGNFELLNLALPLAISFYTLQQIAFIIDSYEGLVEEKNFLNYALFVTFFPQLIAGPIVHHSEVMPQFANIKNKLLTISNVNKGLFIFSIGLFKKVVLADTFATWSTQGFDYSTSLTFFEAWSTSLSYTFQIYFDFSGYTDMAIGAALLFNIKLPQNFNSPYMATNIVDFWKRWHITLTNFITTYVYTPMVRVFDNITFSRMMIAILGSFLVSGLWHGASWTFVLWGLMHGLGIVVFHCWNKFVKIKFHRFVAWFITFNFINITLIVFRATQVEDIFKVLKGMFGLNGVILPAKLAEPLAMLGGLGVKFDTAWLGNINGSSDTVLCLFMGAGICFFAKNSAENLAMFKPGYKTAFVTIGALSLGILSMNKVSEFLYFNF